MFASAFKSISSNINSGYTVSPTQTATAGPWKIYDAKKKSSGRACSVFVLDRKSLSDPSSSSSAFPGRSNPANESYKRAVAEVVERLRREAQSLARLRHPSVLELVEPVEDTRGGGLQFVTEHITASLAGLLQDKDEAERSTGRGRGGVTDEATKRRREMELDELEIQKGLLQVSKALEFLHDNAGFVHGNLTPDAIVINAKGDWKLGGLSFCGPPAEPTKPTSLQPINLGDLLESDPRLPQTVKLDLNYTSPDFVLDNNINTFADMFSLGLLAIALYSSPHQSPIQVRRDSVQDYKRLFSSPSNNIPSMSNGFLCKKTIPRDLSQFVLPRLITRRPAGRMAAREFQNSEYFNNIFVSTIRFLDDFPAKTPGEKAQFMRGLNKVLPSFPKSVMEKKVLPALLGETKDKELLSLILQDVLRIVELLPWGAKPFGELVLPSIKDIFVTNAKKGEAAQERDPARDAGLMVVVDNLGLISKFCAGKEFKDDILPILLIALESPTPPVIDIALRSLPTVLPILDFSTIKNELFPVVASVFGKTNSLAIKIRGLNAFIVLCGGSPDDPDDGLGGVGVEAKKASHISALDKFTMQDRIVPLVKAIKTKEPAVMMAALNVLRMIGQVADTEFVAMEILPTLWGMSLGPLLDLKQFQIFIDLIKTLSRRVEDEQIRKLQELAGGSEAMMATPNEDFLGFGGITGTQFDAGSGVNEDDFERLVRGGAALTSHPSATATPTWDEMSSNAAPARSKTSTPSAPMFNWSTPSPLGVGGGGSFGATNPSSSFRTVTPDLGRFEALSPSSTQFSQPLQPTPVPPTFPTLQPASTPSQTTTSTPSAAFNWSSATPNPWSSTLAAAPAPAVSNGNTFVNLTPNQVRPALSQNLSFSLPPPPPPPPPGNQPATSGAFGGLSGSSGFRIPPPPGAATQNVWASSGSTGSLAGLGQLQLGGMNIDNMSNMSALGSGSGMGGIGTKQPPGQQKSGLDKYGSLL